MNVPNGATERQRWSLILRHLGEAIQAIRRKVCEHFYLREMRDPELTVRSNRRGYVLPRRLAMYIARQLAAATLQEIGREFGNRHHSMVLHAISKIEAMRRTDQALDLIESMIGSKNL